MKFLQKGSGVMDFKIRVLRYFVTVAEQGSVTRASELLHVAQPSLSQRIRTFEDLLGFPLFERSHGSIKLSEQGKVFLPLARELVITSDQAGLMVRNLRDGNVGTLRIGGSWFNMERPEVSGLVDRFADEFSSVEVIVERGLYSPELLTKLKLKELDLAFISGVVDTDIFDKINLQPMVFDLLVPKRSALAKAKEVDRASLSGLQVVWYRRKNNPHIYDAVNNYLVACGAEILTPPDTHRGAMIRYAQRTGNCTLIGRGTPIEAEDMVAVPFPSEIITFESSLARIKGGESRMVEQFWRWAEDQLTDDDISE